MSKKKKIDIDQEMNKLKKIVENIESDNLKLDEVMEQFKEGISLINTLKNELQKYELEIEKVIKENNIIKTEPLNEEDLLNGN